MAKLPPGDGLDPASVAEIQQRMKRSPASVGEVPRGVMGTSQHGL